MSKHKHRIEVSCRYKFIYEYSGERVEFVGVERFGIWQNGIHSLKTVVDGREEEHQIGIGWVRMIIEPLDSTR